MNGRLNLPAAVAAATFFGLLTSIRRARRGNLSLRSNVGNAANVALVRVRGRRRRCSGAIWAEERERERTSERNGTSGGFFASFAPLNVKGTERETDSVAHLVFVLSDPVSAEKEIAPG